MIQNSSPYLLIFQKDKQYNFVDFVGTGFIISSDGIFCTVAHVVRDKNSEYLVGFFNNGNDVELIESKILFHEYVEGSSNPRIDLCFGKINISTPNYLEFDRNNDWNYVYINGFPAITQMRFNIANVLVTGSLNIKQKACKVNEVITCNNNSVIFKGDRIEKNMSGSPLINRNDKVVGVLYGTDPNNVKNTSLPACITSMYIIEKLKETKLL